MDRGENFLRDSLGLRRRILGLFAQVLQQHYKLISAQSRHRVGFADAGQNPPRHLLQQQIANVMAERVVQRLEVIEIDEQQRSLAIASRTLAARVCRNRSSRSRRLGRPVSGSKNARFLISSCAAFSCCSSRSRRVPAYDAQVNHRDSRRPATGVSPHMPTNHHDAYHGVSILKANSAFCSLHTPSPSCASISSSIGSGRQFRKLQFSLRSLGPGRIRALEPVAKQNAIFVGNIQRRVSCDQRVRVHAERRIALPGNIRSSHHQFGENYLDRHFGR